MIYIMDYSNTSIIKNQESDEINILNEQQKYLENMDNIETFQNQESMTSEANISQQEESQKNSIWDIINKYKFWIIASIILILLIVMSIKCYTSSKSTSTMSGGEILSTGSFNIFKLHSSSLPSLSSSSFMPSDFVSS